MSVARSTHIAERPRVWVAVFVLTTTAIGLLIVATEPALEPLVYAPLSAAAVTLYGFLAAKGNQVFFGERTDHLVTWQRFWVGVLLVTTITITVAGVTTGQPLLAAALSGLFVALPVSAVCLLAAKANQVLFT